MAEPKAATTPDEAELIPVEDIELEPTKKLLLERLLPEIDEDEQEAIHTAIMSDIDGALQDRLEWENRLADWDDLYYGNLPAKNFPWPGASNLHVPLTLVGVETLKPRLVEVILGDEQPVHAIPTRYTSNELRDRVETFLNWQLMTEMDLENKVPASAHLFLLPGTVVSKVFWKITRKRVRYLRTFPITMPIEEAIRTILGPSVKVEENLTKGTITRLEGTYRTSPNGGPEDVEFKLDIATSLSELLILVDMEEVDERPHIEIIDPLDFVMPAKAQNPQTTPWCAHRTWMEENDLRMMVKQGRFYKDAVERLLGEAEPEGDEEAEHGQAARDTRDQQEGVTGNSETDVRLSQWQVWEVPRRYDIDDDGIEEEMVFWVSPELPGLLLGYDYLSNIHAHGMRPFAVGRYHPIPFRFYGLSFPQLVEQLQREINTIHNQRVDYGTIQNLPMYFFKGSSAHSPLMYKIRPGEGVPVDNPQTDIVFPKWQGNPAWASQEEALLYQYFERATGVTDLALGRQPNRVGATRTASGVATLLSEAGLRFKTAMSAFQRFWKDIFQLVLALDQQYLPPGKEFRVTGRLPEYIRLESRADIAGKFDLRLTPTTENLNKSVMREDSTVILQTLSNPAWMQSGLVGIRGMDQTLRDFLRAHGKDPDQYLEPVTQQITHTPEEELGFFLMGKTDHAPSPVENIQEHLATHALQLRDPAVQSELGPEGMVGLQKHLQATQKLYQTQLMMQGLQAKGQPAAIAGPQRQNAETGKTAPNAPATQAEKGGNTGGEQSAGTGAARPPAGP